MKLKWIDRLLPAQDSPQSDTASGSEELPKVDSDSDKDPEEWEPELGPSADQPVAQSNQQQPAGVQTHTRNVVPPDYYCCGMLGMSSSEEGGV